MYKYVCEVESLCDNKTPRGFCSLTVGKCWNAANRPLKTTGRRKTVRAKRPVQQAKYATCPKCKRRFRYKQVFCPECCDS